MTTGATREKLMLVDRPRILLTVVCAFNGSTVTLKSFKQQLEKTLLRTDNPLHIKTAHTYFYTATTYELFTPIEGQKGVYRISETGSLLCQLAHDSNRYADYQKALQSILLSNRKKGPLFREFLDFVKNTALEKEIFKEFQPPTGKTLIAWGLEAGLICKKGDAIAPIRLRTCPPTLEEFWSELLIVFKRMQRTQTMGIKRLAVRVDELRLRVLSALNLQENLDFERYLEQLMRSKYRDSVDLYGGPSHVLADPNKVLNYNSKVYAYISVKETANVDREETCRSK